MREAKPKRKQRREHRLLKRPSGKWPLYLVYLAAAAGLLVAGGVAIRSSNRTPKESVQSQMIHAGQNVVRNNLIEGIHPAFGGVEETMIDPLPDNKFMISGWVDLVTDAGRQDRQNYSVVIYRNEMNDWVGEKVSFIPQM